MIILPIAFMNITNRPKLPRIHVTQLIKSMYSSSDQNGVTLREQLKYVKITLKEISVILWDSFRDHIIKERENKGTDTK